MSKVLWKSICFQRATFLGGGRVFGADTFFREDTFFGRDTFFGGDDFFGGNKFFKIEKNKTFNRFMKSKLAVSLIHVIFWFIVLVNMYYIIIIIYFIHFFFNFCDLYQNSSA